MATQLVLTDLEYQITTLRYWLTQLSDLDEVTVIVRRHGRIVRTVLISPDGDATPRNCRSVPPRPDAPA